MTKQTITVHLEGGIVEVYHNVVEHDMYDWREYGLLQEFILLDHRCTEVQGKGAICIPWHNIRRLEIVEEEAG